MYNMKRLGLEKMRQIEVDVPIFGDQDMEKGSHESPSEIRPGTLSESSTEWHEILRYNIRVKILISIENNIKTKIIRSQKWIIFAV